MEPAKPSEWRYLYVVRSAGASSTGSDRLWIHLDAYDALIGEDSLPADHLRQPAA
jgi:hypothetical protein